MELSYNEIKEKVLACVPKVCPICGFPLTLSNDLMHLTCDNPECDGKISRKLEIAAKALGIDNIGPGVAKELVDHLNVRKIYQVFDLTVDDFKRVPRYQDGMADRLYSSIHAVSTVKFAQLIRACQFLRVGEGTAHDIASAYNSLDEFLNASVQDISTKLGMSEQVAFQVKESVDHNRDAAKELETRLHVEYVTKVSGGNPTGKTLTCVVTGPLGFGTRPEFQSVYGDAYGIKWGSSVTNKTDILVTNETTPTGKFRKAKELQAAGNPIKIMTEEEFLNFIGSHETNTADARVAATQAAITNLTMFDGSDAEL